MTDAVGALREFDAVFLAVGAHIAKRGGVIDRPVRLFLHVEIPDPGHNEKVKDSKNYVRAGPEGLGKSTLLLKVVDGLVSRGARALYVSAEESTQQVRLRADRLGTLS